MTDAIISWYRTVYMPVIDMIERKHIMRIFPRNTKSDLYVWLIKYWDELKQKFGADYSLAVVADDFSKKYGSTIGRRIMNKIKRLMLKAGTGTSSQQTVKP